MKLTNICLIQIHLISDRTKCWAKIKVKERSQVRGDTWLPRHTRATWPKRDHSSRQKIKFRKGLNFSSLIQFKNRDLKSISKVHYIHLPRNKRGHLIHNHPTDMITRTIFLMPPVSLAISSKLLAQFRQISKLNVLWSRLRLVVIILIIGHSILVMARWS
jgi:hypothetical protein